MQAALRGSHTQPIDLTQFTMNLWGLVIFNPFQLFSTVEYVIKNTQREISREIFPGAFSEVVLQPPTAGA